MNISLVNNSPNTRSTLRQFYLFHSWYLNCGMCMLTSVHMSCMCLILASLLDLSWEVQRHFGLFSFQ